MAVKEYMYPLESGHVHLNGVIGKRMQQCIDQRIANQDIERLVKPFRIRNDGPDKFRGEFWGKWFTALVLAYTYTPTDALKEKMQEAVSEIVKTQTDDGCISTHKDDVQHGHWDTWSRKYVLLGLLHYYQVSTDASALVAAEKMVQHFMTQVGPEKINLSNTGHWAWEGLAPNSILEPLALLAQITGKQEYTEFCLHLVARWKDANDYAEEGLRLVDAALEGKDAKDVGNHKAYEQMSCFEGLCELYRQTEERRYLDAAISLAENIRKTELTVAGSGSNHETWCHGARYQTEVFEQAQETCVTVTWIKLCYKLLQLTGDASWADDMEQALFNALSASVTPDGTWWSYYSPLIGERVASHYQFEEIGLSCCVASGPRAMLLTHRWAVMQDEAGPIVNFYGQGKAQLHLADASAVSITQETQYPVQGAVSLRINVDEAKAFNLRLRIPAWSRETQLQINGEELKAKPGSYTEINREWQDGDEITLDLDMRCRAIAAPSGAPAFAVMRGPILLALDNRVQETLRSSLRLVVDEDSYIDGALQSDTADDFLLSCTITCTYHKVHIVTENTSITMCDYASAGNKWSGDNVFRVWLPQPLFMEHAYLYDTWKLMYPDMDERPDIPSARNDFDN